jgi:translation initiation factor 2D
VGALLRPIFEAAHGSSLDKDRLYSPAECEAALRAYAAAHGLTTAAGGASADAADAISLDAFLAAGLFNKKEAVPAGAVPAGDLADRLVARLAEHTVVKRAAPGGGGVATTTIKKGGPPKLTVSLEDRVGGRKHLTHLVGGIEAFGLSTPDLAAVLQKRFKTSASVARAGPDASSIALQGDLVAQVVDFLATEYGLGGRHVEVKVGR